MNKFAIYFNCATIEWIAKCSEIEWSVCMWGWGGRLDLLRDICNQFKAKNFQAFQ